MVTLIFRFVQKLILINEKGRTGMKLVDVIIALSSNRPWWENLLRIVFFLWFAFANGVAVYGMVLTLMDRKKILAEEGTSCKEVCVSFLSVVVFIFFIVITLFFLSGLVLALVDIFLNN
jgi:hypothetical protein